MPSALNTIVPPETAATRTLRSSRTKHYVGGDSFQSVASDVFPIPSPPLERKPGFEHRMVDQHQPRRSEPSPKRAESRRRNIPDGSAPEHAAIDAAPAVADCVPGKPDVSRVKTSCDNSQPAGQESIEASGTATTGSSLAIADEAVGDVDATNAAPETSEQSASRPVLSGLETNLSSAELPMGDLGDVGGGSDQSPKESDLALRNLIEMLTVPKDAGRTKTDGIKNAARLQNSSTPGVTSAGFDGPDGLVRLDPIEVRDDVFVNRQDAAVIKGSGSASPQISDAAPAKMDQHPVQAGIGLAPSTNRGTAPTTTLDAGLRAVSLPDLPIQVARIAVGLRTGEESQIRLRLDPPSLGALNVHISASEHGINVRIVAQTQEAYTLLQSGQSPLRDELARWGLSLSHYSTSLASDDRRAPDEYSRPGARTAGRAASPITTVSESIGSSPSQVHKSRLLDARV